MSAPPYPRIASLKTAEALRAHLAASNIALPFDDVLAAPAESPLARPFEAGGVGVGNRFCVLPMEGWDGTREGEPTELTTRRWRNFGLSGAKLVWGGEAMAVRADGRDSAEQLVISRRTLPAVAALRETLAAAHRERFGLHADRDLFIGLQLTHSGRFSKPDPLVACANPLLDTRFASPPRVVSDADLGELVTHFVEGARLAHEAGFGFVDVKQCHGYLGHELLGARTRPGPYGGSRENRFRFVREVIGAIRAAVPQLHIGVRLSAVDTVPFRKDALGRGVAETHSSDVPLPGFGLLNEEDFDGSVESALDDSRALLAELETLGVRWICITAGTPYYNPHVLRPAFFPPADGYQPPEDPLRGVARHIGITARLKAEFPNLIFVGSGYSYLQEWLPHVAQHTLRHGMTDFVGLGRMMLAYPSFAADVLAGRPLARGSICRTFSDCTTGPRLGLMSGCYPLDPFYAARPEAEQVKRVRTEMTVRSG